MPPGAGNPRAATAIDRFPRNNSQTANRRKSSLYIFIRISNWAHDANRPRGVTWTGFYTGRRPSSRAKQVARILSKRLEADPEQNSLAIAELNAYFFYLDGRSHGAHPATPLVISQSFHADLDHFLSALFCNPAEDKHFSYKACCTG